MNLSNLKKNESGVISAIRLSGSIKRRLSDMGMTLGAAAKMLDWHRSAIHEFVYSTVTWVYGKGRRKRFLFTRVVK